MRHVVGLLLRMAIALPLALILLGGFAAWLLAEAPQAARQRILGRRMGVPLAANDDIVLADTDLAEDAGSLSWTESESAHGLTASMT